MASLTKYSLKCINEDFQVTEVSLMPPIASKGFKKHTYIWFQKSGFTTFEALEQIKDTFKLSFDDVCSQGLKDEDAVTEQLISVRKILSEKDIELFNKKYFLKKDKFSKIKYVLGYGRIPIKERALHGNSFKIVVRNLSSALANQVQDYVTKNKQMYFINYYDNQRFGMPGGPYNTHLIGKGIVDSDWKRAYKEMSITNNLDKNKILKSKNAEDYKKEFAGMNPKKVSFFVSAYNSYLWNSTASDSIKKNTKSILKKFEHVGNLYLPTTHNFKCDHICEAKGYEFVIETFSTKSKSNKRSLLIATNIYVSDLGNDELHKKKKKITLSFYLPTGSYATMIIKQIFLNLNK